MVSSLLCSNMSKRAEHENLVQITRFTTATTATTTGDGKVHELTAIDLAFKFHYIKGIYFFNNIRLEILKMKELTCQWLMSYATTCGRIRVPEAGRPFIKLNDAGIRYIEAQASTTIDEWFSMEGSDYQDKLVPDHAEGFELSYTPLVLLQMTRFKCGGMSIGLSWAHVLGDMFSAISFMNSMGLSLQGNYSSTLHLDTPSPPSPRCSRSVAKKPVSLKPVDPTDNSWTLPTTHKMATHTFHLKSDQLVKLYSSTIHAQAVFVDYPEDHDRSTHIRPFELVSAILWACIARIREDQTGLKTVTLCCSKTNLNDREKTIPYNGLEVDIVSVDFSVSEADTMKLASALVEEKVEENGMIEEMVEEAMAEQGKCDCILYGANLTFINMEGTNVYGFEVQGQKPTFARYSIECVGEGGAILVGDGPEIINEGINDDKNGTIVIAILPENEVEQLKNMLKRDYEIV
ncbi:ECERIFERUM 26-like protein [Drosera capensis]